MSSIQQRLLQREPLDSWSIREQLCLASAVARGGDQNWMSVSRALRAVADPGRPPDWYQQKSCAAQYGALLEGAETPKRKKRTSEPAAAAAETPQDVILKRLTAERVAELQKLMADCKSQYAVLKEEIAEARSPATSDTRLREMLASVETARRQREREQQRHALWLRERDERRKSAEKARRPITTVGGGLSPPASSPLLTSLLKNTSPGATPPSPVVTQMLHIPHPSTLIDVVSPSASAPTLSMLLEKGRESVSTAPAPVPAPLTPSSSDAAVIEQIKSELQEIENSLRMGNIPSTTSPIGLVAPLPLAGASSSVAAPVQVPTMDKGPPVDIDDIEIKAEDVYAFSDMDLEIQPVSSIHKNSLTRSLEKSSYNKKEDSEETASLLLESPAAPTSGHHVEVKEELEEGPTVEVPESSQVPEEATTPQVDTSTDQAVTQDVTQDTTQDNIELSIPLPPESPPESVAAPPEQDARTAGEGERDGEQVLPPLPVETTTDDPPLPPELPPAESPAEAETASADTESADTAQAEEPTEPVVETTQEPEVIKEEVASEVEAEPDEMEGREELEQASERDDTKLEERSPQREKQDWEDTSETKAEVAEPEAEVEAEVPTETEAEGEVEREEKPSEAEETHTETDDDTPMEVIREEEKAGGGRKRRDYSRRKAQPPSDSRACSGSESAAETSAPSSPVAVSQGTTSTPTPDPDRDHRLWKKSVMLVYNRLCAHKYASLFLRPITDDLAPDYSLVVRRPMDLTTIKRNIDSGVIRTTAEFQRDVLLMLSNALFYNNSRHRVHLMAQEMHQEAAAQLGMLLQAQAHAALADSHAEPPARRSLPHGKRKRTSSPHLHAAASPAAKRLRDE